MCERPKSPKLFRFSEQDLRDILSSIATSYVMSAAEPYEQDMDTPELLDRACELILWVWKENKKLLSREDIGGIAPIVDAVEAWISEQEGNHDSDSAE